MSSPVSTLKAVKREYEKSSFYILITSDLVTDHLSTIFSFFLKSVAYILALKITSRCKILSDNNSFFLLSY